MINDLFSRVISFTNKQITRKISRNNFKIKLNKPIISFTFDDFPQSAANVGLELLSKYGVKGTFYISFNLIDKVTPTGKNCSIEDIKRIIETGNNLGCHTYNHLGAFEQSNTDFEESLVNNQRYLKKLFPELNFSVFSYPKGQVKASTKKITQKYFTCSRGISPGINNHKVDLNLLNGTSIYGEQKTFSKHKRYIDQNLAENGWLIFYTHDLSDKPTRFGTTPALFEKILKYSIEVGSEVLTIEETGKLLNFPRN